MEQLTVTAQPTPDGTCVILCLSGEADATTTALRDALTAEIAGKPRLLLLDLTGLTFIDSGAMQMIVAAHHVLTREGAALALANPRATVSRVLQLTGLNQVIPVYGSVDEAITSVE